jgi:hypothetical protein
MKLFYLVAMGRVVANNGTVYLHGTTICSFDSDLTPTQIAQVSEALGCANLDLVDKEGLKAYKE